MLFPGDGGRGAGQTKTDIPSLSRGEWIDSTPTLDATITLYFK